jgi:hypothetical protein
MREMNERKLYFLRRYGSLLRAASELGIENAQLSVVLNGHRPPRPSERRKLKATLSPYYYTKFFGKPRAKVEKIVEGAEAIGE